MVFNSFSFLVFFSLTFLIYFCVNSKYRYLVLLVASYLFYGISNFKYLLILIFITLISYFSGYFVDKFNDYKYKKVTIFFNVFICLAILLYFKYFNFILHSFNFVFDSNFSIENFAVPLGISFFILQAITYPIDLYRKDVKVEKNILKYSLFISFFPQILSGPIGKSKEMLPQFNCEHKFVKRNVYYGFMLMLYGYFQKIVVADLLSFGVNNVYNNLESFTGLPILIVVFLYSFQIYFDFVSYSNIALGCAKVFGYDLINNFNKPYFATSIKDFWNRWHISLSSWFKNYLYIPLGGNRCGKFRMYLNLMIVFLVSGLWHGAYYTYIIWGLLHGVYQVFERIINKKFHSKIVNIIVTFLLVTFAWIFFRANTIEDAFYVIKNMFNIDFYNIKSQILSIGFDFFDLVIILISFVVIFEIEYIGRNKNLLSILYKKSSLLKYSIAIVLIFVIIIFGYYGPGFDNSQFIYLGY